MLSCNNHTIAILLAVVLLSSCSVYCVPESLLYKNTGVYEEYVNSVDNTTFYCYAGFEYKY